MKDKQKARSTSQKYLERPVDIQPMLREVAGMAATRWRRHLKEMRRRRRARNNNGGIWARSNDTLTV